MRLIGELLRRGRRHSGAVLLIEGEPGMGKSLLLASTGPVVSRLSRRYRTRPTTRIRGSGSVE